MVHRKMSDDYGQDTVPVKEIPEHSRKGFSHEAKDDIVQQRRVVFKLPREELEDRFLRLCEENLLLKRHSSKQEDRIKKMATKLVRLINDHKKQEPGGIVSRKRDLETEELIEEMQDKIRDLDRQNTLLKEKLVAAKQQLAMHTKRIAPFHHSHKRQNARHPKATVGRHGYSKEVGASYSPHAADSGDSSPQGGLSPREGGGRVPGPSSRSRMEHSRNPYREGERIEGRRHTRQWDGGMHHSNNNADEVIAGLKEQLDAFDNEIESLKNQLRKEQEDHEEELLGLKSQVTQTHRQNVQENVELIKLQRETKQTNDKMASLLEQYNKLQQNYHVLKGSHEQLLREIDNLAAQLKEEQRRGFTLQTEVQSAAANNLVIAEYKEQIAALQKENGLIRESNAKLMNSTFNVERDRLLHNSETSLKIQLAQLEATVKADLEDKNVLLSKLTLQKDESARLEQELRKLQTVYYHTKEEYDQLKEKLASISQDGSVNFVELEHALLLVRQGKDSNVPSMEFLQKSTDDTDKSLRQQLQELEIDHAETVNELAKIRSMLQLQYKINNDYKDDVDQMRRRLQQVEQETTERLEEYTRLLNLRADHVKQLEEQLKETMSQRRPLTPSSIREVQKEEEDSDISFSQKGEHIFEIHMKRVILNKESLYIVEQENPALFLTWSFYHFEPMNSGIIKGTQPEFRKTAQYQVVVDNPFLQYLRKEEMVVTLHQAVGVEYTTLASAQVRFRELLDVSHGRLHGSVPLIGFVEHEDGIVLGNLEYWVAFQAPATTSKTSQEVPGKPLPFLEAIQDITDEAVRTLQKKESYVHFPSTDATVVSSTTVETNELDGSVLLAGSSSMIPVPQPRKPREEDMPKHSASEPTMTSTPSKQGVYEKPPIPPRNSHPKISKQASVMSPKEAKAKTAYQSESERTMPIERVEEEGENYSDDDDDDQDGSDDDSSEDNSRSSDPDAKEGSPSTGDSEDVVTPTPGVTEDANKVVVEVNHLTIKEGSDVLTNPNIQMLFVEYKFLGYPPEELETPYALPKPKPNQSIAFNFHKVFHVDPENNYKKRQFLASMLLPNSPDRGRIMFTVVSEPPEDLQDMDCEEVGYAYVDLHAILKQDRDFINHNAKVYDARNKDTVIGFLNVNVELLEVLKMVKAELVNRS